MIITGKKILVLLGGLAALLAFSCKPSHIFEPPKKSSVVFLSVGQGDSALIRFEDGQTMLVDCGSDSGVLSALGRHLGFFEKKIDYLVVSHPDLDHYGGCIDVLDRYDVKKIIVNDTEKPNDNFFAEWKMKSSKVPTEIISGHRNLVIASSTLEFFSPDPSLKFKARSDSNDRSIVFKLVMGSGKSYLFTGDAEESLEKELLRNYCPKDDPCPLRSDILKVGHHGSEGSSSEDFLLRAHPSVAVISVGKNKFGHPRLRTIRHLERAGAEIRRTDQEGDIEL